jgi:hypothetical protein
VLTGDQRDIATAGRWRTDEPARSVR